jgi:hypothetical protein
MDMVNGNATPQPMKLLAQPITRGVFCVDVAVPAGTTAIDFKIIVGNGSFTGTAAFGQRGLFNLTTMGTLS